MRYTFLLVAFGLGIFSLGSSAEEHSPFSERIAQRPQVSENSESNESQLLARMSDETSSSGYRQLIVYFPTGLRNVEFKVGDAENWNTMRELKSETHKAYGTESFLPAAPGQRFFVRFLLEDGTRVTSELEIEPKSPYSLKVKPVKKEAKGSFAEARPVQKSESLSETSAVLMKAQASLGRRLGSGDCSALRGNGPALGRIGSGGSGLERLMPGQVLRLSAGAGMSGSMGFFRAGETGHFIVVESVSPDGQITFLDQNWAGGSSSGQTVRRAHANLRTLNGSATIYSGN